MDKSNQVLPQIYYLNVASGSLQANYYNSDKVIRNIGSYARWWLNKAEAIAFLNIKPFTSKASIKQETDKR